MQLLDSQLSFRKKYTFTCILLVSCVITGCVNSTFFTGNYPEGSGSSPVLGEQSYTAAEIQQIVALACRRSHPIEHYRGIGGGHEMIGPLWLTKPGKRQVLGVILTPFLRLYHYGRSQGCSSFNEEIVRKLAEPEVWVVLWQLELPPQEVTNLPRHHRPVEVSLYTNNRWSQPERTEYRNEFLRDWFPNYWVEHWHEPGILLAAFDSIDRSDSLLVEYETVETGGSYKPTKSVSFTINYPDR